MLIESFINAVSHSNWQSATAVNQDAHTIITDVKTAYAKDAVWIILIGLILLILIQFVLGPFLWNNVLRKLFPRVGLGPAAWYDVFALHMLLALIVPVIQPAAWLSTNSLGFNVSV
jgi:hypothetical protein